MRVKLRGIYATALTDRLRGDFAVVQASPPIRERFDAGFPDAPADATVEMTRDRGGVGISGDPETVASVADAVGDVGLDAFTYGDSTPRGAVFDGLVDRTLGGGAVVALGDDAEGYLPFDDADDYVEEGDRVRVQVADPAPPWDSNRPRVTTTLRAFGDVASLVRGRDALVAATPDGSADHELARTTEMLSTGVPEDWAVEWGYAAEDASMSDLDDALADAVETASTIDDALAAETDDEPARLVAAAATTWVWFGRDARSALDDHRRDVTATMVGHHRVKAGSESASTAVDFAESLGGLPDEFPFAAVSAQFGPSEGDAVSIEHGKPDGRLFTLGRGAVTDCDPDAGRITVEREMTGGGTYDALGVEREEGDVAITRFQEGRWWYPTVYRSEDGPRKGTYVNVNTPLELFPDSVRYVDLHVDVVKHAEGTTEQVDADELQDCVDSGTVSEPLAERAHDVADRIEDAFAE